MPFQHTIHYFVSCIFRNNSISVIYSLKRIPHWTIALNVWETTSNFTRNSTFILVILRNTSKFYIWIVYTLERKQSPESVRMADVTNVFKATVKALRTRKKVTGDVSKNSQTFTNILPSSKLKGDFEKKSKEVVSTVIMNRISCKFLNDLWVFNSS